MNEGIGQFVAGRIINTGHRRASYIDLSGTLFLRQSDPVDQADDSYSSIPMATVSSD